MRNSDKKNIKKVGVCCVFDPALKKYISKHGKLQTCDCCCSKKVKALDKEQLFNYIEKVIYKYYEDGNGCLPTAGSWIDSEEDYEFLNEENGLVAPKNRFLGDTYDLVTDQLRIFEDENLAQEFIDRLGMTTWCERDPFGLPISEELEYDWLSYCQMAKTEDRPTLMWKLAQKDIKSSENRLNDILTELQRLILKKKLFRIFPKGTQLFRTRNYDSSELVATFADIAAPPAYSVKFPNRMSRAYESVFYAALDNETCKIEAQDGSKPHTAMGIFSTRKDLNLLDFSKLPRNRSIFDQSYDEALNFLQIFSRELSKPISPSICISEYRPTQIMTEYFRYGFSLISKIRIDGIIYRSSKVQNGENCILFYDDKDCKNIVDLIRIHTIK